METYILTNDNISEACENVGSFLTAKGVDRRDTLRIKLMFEEVLLNYQAKFGETADFKLKFTKRFPATKLELSVAGEAYNPLDDEQDGYEVIQALLANMGLAPAWSYKNGKNYLVFTPKKKAMSGTVKMLIAILLSVVAALVLKITPETFADGVQKFLLKPITDAMMGLITTVAGPLIFLSVLSSICSMGNMETFGRIGTKTIKTIIFMMVLSGLAMTGIGSLFFKVEWGGADSSNLSLILDLLYDIVPHNPIDPFITGNVMQIIFMAIIMGLAMLVLASGTNEVFKVVDQLSSIMQTIMLGISSVLPILIFVLFTDMIIGDKLGYIINSWKAVVIALSMMIVCFLVIFLRTIIKKKVSPGLLLKKLIPTCLVGLMTGSAAAAFSTNIRECHESLGIDKKLVNFAIPFGQVLYMPSVIASLFCVSASFAESHGVKITISWLVISFVTCTLLAFAIPPVRGGAMMGYTIAFANLGIPMDLLGIALVIDTVFDFPAAATNLGGWQLGLINVAGSLNMLDEKTLRKKP